MPVIDGEYVPEDEFLKRLRKRYPISDAQIIRRGQELTNNVPEKPLPDIIDKI